MWLAQEDVVCFSYKEERVYLGAKAVVWKLWTSPHGWFCCAHRWECSLAEDNRGEDMSYRRQCGWDLGSSLLPTTSLGGKGEGMRSLGLEERKTHGRTFLFWKFGDKNICWRAGKLGWRWEKKKKFGADSLGNLAWCTNRGFLSNFKDSPVLEKLSCQIKIISLVLWHVSTVLEIGIRKVDSDVYLCWRDRPGARNLNFVCPSWSTLTVNALYSNNLSQTPAVPWQGSFLVLDHFPTKMPCFPIRLVDCYSSGSGFSRNYRHEFQLSRELTECLTCARHTLETKQSAMIPALMELTLLEKTKKRIMHYKLWWVCMEGQPRKASHSGSKMCLLKWGLNFYSKNEGKLYLGFLSRKKMKLKF